MGFRVKALGLGFRGSGWVQCSGLKEDGGSTSLEPLSCLETILDLNLKLIPNAHPKPYLTPSHNS